MSLISRLLFGSAKTADNVLSVGALPTLSPWAGASKLEGLVYSDIYGPTETEAVTRETAMTVAPLARGRGVIIGALGDQPFEQGDWDGENFNADDQQPEWLTRTNTEQTAYHRFTLSLDDLMFTGWCLWAVERDEAGTITDAARVDRSRWTFDSAAEATGLSLDGRPITDPSTVMLFMGPHEGLLTVARETIRGWRHMERAWVGRVRNPIPALVIKEDVQGQVNDDEAAEIVGKIAANRSSPNGAVMFLPYGLTAEALGQVEADLFNEGRNAARIDVANHMNLPVSAVDGSTATASLTYVTQEGDAAQLSDDLDFWIAPFEARLSKEAPDGKRIRLRRSNQPDAKRGGDAAPAPAPEATA
ncbi:phage portal protein [Microbacterium sp. NPDC077663]|uniref:phage portal protein n=1 Tax=Microbacterium sp. NPDC077663 TaxID=3364189 RepID=UPI0037CB5327